MLVPRRKQWAFRAFRWREDAKVVVRVRGPCGGGGGGLPAYGIRSNGVGKDPSEFFRLIQASLWPLYPTH